MGKYLDIAKRFDAEQKEEGQPNPQRHVAVAPPLYRETAEALADDCYAIDPGWLIERHPELWRRLVSLDIQAVQLERQDTAGEAYRRVLRDIVAEVQSIRVLYEAEQSKLPRVQ